MKIRTKYTFKSNSFPCFRVFPMFWNVASARDEISLRKCSGGTAQLHTLEHESQTHVWPRGSFVRPAILFGIFK